MACSMSCSHRHRWTGGSVSSVRETSDDAGGKLLLLAFPRDEIRNVATMRGCRRISHYLNRRCGEPVRDIISVLSGVSTAKRRYVFRIRSLEDITHTSFLIHRFCHLRVPVSSPSLYLLVLSILRCASHTSRSVNPSSDRIDSSGCCCCGR